jgi:tryptophanyl-tRNA synthetase
VTDSKSPEEPKDPETCNIFALHKLFLSGDALESFRSRYLNGGIGYKESKEMLVSEILAVIGPMRDARKKFESDPAHVAEILALGAQKARAHVTEKMKTIRARVGITH